MKYQYFKPNSEGRDFVCSDIHGCFTDFENRLDEIEFNEDIDRLFCVGDLVDRGPESERCMEFLQKPWFYTVKGNHEELTLMGYEDVGDFNLVHMQNGGSWFYTLIDAEQEDIVTAFKELPLIIQVGNYGIIHAEPHKTISTWSQLIEACEKSNTNAVESILWGRTRIKYGIPETIEGIDTIYVGHTVISETKTLGNIHYIDTGQFLRYYPTPSNKGYLTIIELNH